MRSGFSMIELVIVTVIIGILASVAIPKLAYSKDDARATTCVAKFADVVSEFITHYAKKDFPEFKNMTVGELSNLRAGTTNTGIKQGTDDKVVNSIEEGDDLNFYCDGGEYASLDFVQDGTVVKIILKAKNGDGVPVAIKASKIVQKNFNMKKVGDTYQAIITP